MYKGDLVILYDVPLKNKKETEDEGFTEIPIPHPLLNSPVTSWLYQTPITMVNLFSDCEKQLVDVYYTVSHSDSPSLVKIFIVNRGGDVKVQVRWSSFTNICTVKLFIKVARHIKFD